MTKCQRTAMLWATSPVGLHRGSFGVAGNVVSSLERRGWIRWSNPKGCYVATLAGREATNKAVKHRLNEERISVLEHEIRRCGEQATAKKYHVGPKSLKLAVTTGVSWSTYLRLR